MMHLLSGGGSVLPSLVLLVALMIGVCAVNTTRDPDKGPTDER